MPIQNVAGKPFPRVVDPVAPVVYPNGTQAQSAVAPFLVYNTSASAYSTQIAPDGDTEIQLLLFGADYPLKVSGLQLFEGATYYANSTALVPVTNPVRNISFPLGGPGYSTAISSVSTILPTADAVRYQQIVTSTTATNDVRVSGFPYRVSALDHYLYATSAGSVGGVPAPYSVSLDVTLNSGSNIGPGHFLSAGAGGGLVISSQRVPVILWEEDFTQAIADAGYTFAGTLFGIATTFDVVGLWAVPGYSPT